MSTIQALTAAIAGVPAAEGRLIPSTTAAVAAAANSFLFSPRKRILFKSCRLSSSVPYFSFSRKAAAPLASPLVAKISEWAQEEQDNEAGEEEVDDSGEVVAEEVYDGLEGLGIEEGYGAEEEEDEDNKGEESDRGEAVAEGVGGGVEIEEGYGVGEEKEAESFPEPPAGAKLFVGNLPYDVDSESLAHLFDQAGTVEVAEVIYDRETNKSRGFGFITMSTVEEAEKAVEMFHHYGYNGRLLNVNKAAPRGSRPVGPPREYAPSLRIYVGNLPWQIDGARLEQVFSKHGNVVNARVVSDRETGRSRGFGFVIMSSQAETDDAIASLDGQSLDGRQIRVSIAEERPQRF